VRYTHNGGSPATRLRSAVESIPQWRRRLRNVIILNEDGLAMLDRIGDQAGVAIYLDPPYLVKGARYTHDFTPADHERLARAAGRFQSARVVISYYNHTKLAELYPGWTVRPLKATKGLVQGGRRDQRGAVAAPEVLLLNGPSFTASADGWEGLL
jgi:DNA adenine methylase